MASEPTTTTDGPVDELASKLRRTVLQHEPSSIPGREIVQVLAGHPVRRRVRVAHPPRRGGRLHRGRHRRDEHPGPAHADAANGRGSRA